MQCPNDHSVWFPNNEMTTAKRNSLINGRRVIDSLTHTTDQAVQENVEVVCLNSYLELQINATLKRYVSVVNMCLTS